MRLGTSQPQIIVSEGTGGGMRHTGDSGPQRAEPSSVQNADGWLTFQWGMEKRRLSLVPPPRCNRDYLASAANRCAPETRVPPMQPSDPTRREAMDLVAAPARSRGECPGGDWTVSGGRATRPARMRDAASPLPTRTEENGRRVPRAPGAAALVRDTVARSCCQWRGRQTVNVVPCSAVDSTSMKPRCACTISWAMYSPRPRLP